MIDDLIIDVGMNQGQDTEYYLKKGFRVAAIEANPELVIQVKDKLKSYISEGRLTVYNVGILNTPGVHKFYINIEKDDWSSAFKSVGGRTNTQYKEIEVEFVYLRTILNETGIPYYLKIDIEHADLFALQELQYFQEKPKYVSCEAHSIDIIFTMRQLGYNKFKLVNQKNHWKFSPCNPPLEGCYVEEKFTGRHSGPFGEETIGSWVTIEKCIYEWLHKKLGFMERSTLGEGWYDVHATF